DTRGPVDLCVGAVADDLLGRPLARAGTPLPRLPRHARERVAQLRGSLLISGDERFALGGVVGHALPLSGGRVYLIFRPIQRKDGAAADHFGRVPRAGVEPVAGFEVVGHAIHRDAKDSFEYRVALLEGVLVLREDGARAVRENGNLVALALEKPDVTLLGQGAVFGVPVFEAQSHDGGILN